MIKYCFRSVELLCIFSFMANHCYTHYWDAAILRLIESRNTKYKNTILREISWDVRPLRFSAVWFARHEQPLWMLNDHDRDRSSWWSVSEIEIPTYDSVCEKLSVLERQVMFSLWMSYSSECLTLQFSDRTVSF